MYAIRRFYVPSGNTYIHGYTHTQQHEAKHIHTTYKLKQVEW